MCTAAMRGCSDYVGSLGRLLYPKSMLKMGNSSQNALSIEVI